MRLTLADLSAMGYAPDGTRLARERDRPLSPGPAREKELHDAILGYCRARCWPVVHSRMDVPQTAGVGTPDFVIALPGGATLWVEAKTAAGKLRPEQAAWLAALRAVGHRAEVVRSFEEFLSVVQISHESKT